MSPTSLIWPLSFCALLGLAALLYLWVRRKAGLSRVADLRRREALRRFARGEIGFEEYKAALFD